ncbi:MAG: transglutaminase domain-containing protein, partial [Candidatus Hydrogenedentes bacterium]|nr:transglutaminase domain-containing protein [Candidatus Hydrogenedentota bacterium]
ETGGEQNPFTLPVGENVLLSGSMGLGSLSLPALEPGDIIYTDAFDPTIMSVNKAKVEALRRETLNIAGERIDTIVIATTIAGFTTLAWISADSEVVRAETPVGLIIKKITPEEAVAPMEAEESANMLNALSITPSGLIPNPDAKTLHMRITSDDPKLLPPEDTRQRYEKDIFIITRQNPDKESYTEALSDEEKARNLSSDLFIQANHPRILETAKDIIGEAKTSWEKSVRLHSWIYENISKKHVLSIPSALDVLEQRSGDCNEHAVLFTALSRSVGIPTRVVIGLAWSRTLQAFGYHAWVEIYAGHWIAMDPTFGEKVAGPTHIKLLTGSIDQWPRLLSYIDTLSIEIVKEEMDATTL